MRHLWVGLAVVTLASCSKAPDGSGPGDATTSAGGVAFAYRYDFRLPGARISDAQEGHALACEQLGPGRCRITGMTYRVDPSGQISASLDLRVASPIARRMGREGVRAIEQAGGALTGAEITGTDAAGDIAAAQMGKADARSDLADVDRQLARSDLPVAIRRDLTTRRASLIETRRVEDQAAVAAQASVATTPIGFTYRAGTGVGLTARLEEAGQAGYASLIWTLVTTLTLLAYLGPPLILLLLLALLWHRVGRRWWSRAFPQKAVD
jgi:hypothetical protein